MGCSTSSLFGGGTRTVAQPRVSRSEYYNRNLGLHNQPIHRIESEVSARVRAPDPNDNIAIKVLKVDQKVDQNTKAHFTSEYEITQPQNGGKLVIRRGQVFELDIEFNRDYDSTKDDVKLVFRFGKRPTPTKKTHAEFNVSDKDRPGEWGAKIKSQSGSRVTFSVTSPPDCYVGKWTLSTDVIKRANEVTVYRNTEPSDIYILFNPWCKDDQVYMHDAQKLFEYILNENGQIYAGSSKRISKKAWSFGQFEDVVLDCTLYLLDEKSGMPDSVRGNPIAIVRKISALVNSADEGGVLTGNWSGNYAGGTPPLDWTGSVDILTEYYHTKQPVKFGQCWVFSAVVTTICRALGIPCRSVTNFTSAHDTDGTITIDKYFDEKGKKLDFDGDSVWNFHVWNDVWMARPDLPPGYGGWQAIDATPQETSEGIYCTGPVSLHAIKNGEVHLQYDGPFVFAEVNADRVTWIVDKDYYIKVARKQEFSIGRFISTRSATDGDREDITNQYKHKEGSDEERAAVAKANLSSTRPGVYLEGPQDVEFELILDDNTFMGDKVALELRVTNRSGEERTINGHIVIASMYYTGVYHKDIRDHEINKEKLKPGGSSMIPVVIEERDYLYDLMDHCNLKITVLCIIDETKQTFCEVEDLRLRKPHLTIKAPDQVKVGDEFDVEVSFTNPLSVTLTNCNLKVEGPGLSKPQNLKFRNVNPKQEFNGSFKMKPRKYGKRQISVNFNSQEIRSINASEEIMVH